MNPTSTNELISKVPADSFELIEFINLTHDVAQLNAAYLTISVSIILFLGGVFYFFNFKPLQDKLQKQEEKIENERRENKSQLKKLRRSVTAFKNEAMTQIKSSKEVLLTEFKQKNEEIDKRVKQIEDEAKGQIQNLEQKARLTELMDLWEKHHFWQLGSLSVPDNSLRVLIDYLEKCFEYDIALSDTDLLIKNIKDVLKKISESRKDAELNVPRTKMYENLVKAVSHDQYFSEVQKEDITKMAAEVLLVNEVEKT